MAGFKTRSQGDTRETLTDSCRRQIWTLRRMQEELHW